MPWNRTGRLLLACLVTLILPAQAQEATPTLPAAERTFSHTLDNGLKIVVREEHRAPVMVSQVW